MDQKGFWDEELFRFTPKDSSFSPALWCGGAAGGENLENIQPEDQRKVNLVLNLQFLLCPLEAPKVHQPSHVKLFN